MMTLPQMRDGAALAQLLWQIFGALHPLYAPISGNWYQPNTGASSTGNPPANSLRLLPFVVLVGTTFDRFAAEVTIAASGGSPAASRVGIYDTDPATRQPLNLIRELGTIDSTSVAIQSAAITGGNLTLSPGIYWIGVVTQGSPSTAPTYRAGNVPSAFIPFTFASGNSPAAITPPNNFNKGSVSGALPATLSGVTNSTSATPIVMLRAA